MILFLLLFISILWNHILNYLIFIYYIINFIIFINLIRNIVLIRLNINFI